MNGSSNYGILVSDQGFARSSAFKQYRFPFIDHVSHFSTYLKDNGQSPTRLFFVDFGSLHNAFGSQVKRIIKATRSADRATISLIPDLINLRLTFDLKLGMLPLTSDIRDRAGPGQLVAYIRLSLITGGNYVHFGQTDRKNRLS